MKRVLSLLSLKWWLSGCGGRTQRVLETALRNPAVNDAVRFVLKHKQGKCSPGAFFMRIPVVCDFRISLPDGRVLRYTSGGDDEVARRLYWGGFGGYEPETAALFYALAIRAGTTVDVGAYTGYYSLLAAAANPDGRVFAFEPTPRSYQSMLRNIALNEARNVTPLRRALTDADREAMLYLPDGAGEMPTSASLLEGFRSSGTALSVEGVSLDSWTRQQELCRIDLVKLDVEGTEHLVLYGAKETLSRNTPCIVCEVLHGRNESAIHEVLSQFGYRYFWLTDSGPKESDFIEGDPTYRFANWLFCPRTPGGEHRDMCAMCPIE